MKFKVPAVNAPNVNGARDLGLDVPADNTTPPDLAALRAALEGGRVKALYVFDPGPPGSLGDVSWIVAARESGRLPLLIVQGVVQSELTAAADFVLPGSTSFEKDATLHQRPGQGAGRGGRHRGAGRRAGRLPDLRELRDAVRRDGLDARPRAHRDCRRSSRTSRLTACCSR